MTRRSSVDVASTVAGIRPGARRSPLPGHEHQDGWAIVAFPFDSGHVLALRVARRNDFAPFTSVWHRTPDGAWSLYVDGPRLDTACPRYWGPAAEHVRSTDISVEWTAPDEVRVETTDPDLRWTTRMAAGPLVRAVNAVSRNLPERVLRSGPMVRLAEALSEHLLDLGDVTLATPVPGGQNATVLTRQLFPVADGSARLDGEDLGSPATGPETPTFGEARFPARPVVWVGRAYLTIVDDEEYERTIAEVRRERQSDVARHGEGEAADDGSRPQSTATGEVPRR